MKVKAIKDYFDLELNKMVKALDEFDVSEERAKELSSADNKAKQPLVEILEVATPTTDEVDEGGQETKPKKSTRSSKKKEE